MKTLIYFGLLCMTWMPASAQDVDLTKLKKDLRILEKILRTSFSSDEDSLIRHSRHKSDELRPSDVDTMYLKGQGVVLSMSLGRSDIFYPSFSSAEPMIAPLAPVADIPNVVWVGPDNENDEEQLVFIEEMEAASEEVEAVLSEVYEGITIATTSPDANISRELRAEMREIQREQRRALQDLRKQRRELSDKARAKKNLSEDERKAMLDKAKKRNEELSVKVKQYQAKIKQAREESKAKWTGKLDQFESTLMDVLCDYGVMRSLPRDQYLTVILRNADRSGENRKDKVYVWKKTDLMACRDGDITKAQLKTKGNSYTF